MILLTLTGFGLTPGCCTRPGTPLPLTPGGAQTWDSLGYAHHHLGQHSQAIAYYQQAIGLVRGVGDGYTEADELGVGSSTWSGETRLYTGSGLRVPALVRDA
jgi:tetratricopeptide repeat protein